VLPGRVDGAAVPMFLDARAVAESGPPAGFAYYPQAAQCAGGYTKIKVYL